LAIEKEIFTLLQDRGMRTQPDSIPPLQAFRAMPGCQAYVRWLA